MNTKLRRIIFSSYPYILSALCFIIPIFPKFAPLVSMIFFVLWLLEGRFKYRFALLKTEKFRLWLILPIVFVLLHCLRLPFSDNDRGYELFDIQTKLFLVVFPVLFSILPLQLFSIQNIQKYFVGFIGGFLAYEFYVLSRAGSSFFSNNSFDFHHFFYTDLSDYMHPSYAAMFGMFALFFCFYLKQLIKEKKFQYIVNTSIWVISIFILLLSSRAGIISLSMLLVLYIIYCIRKRKGVIQPVIMVIILAVFELTVIQKADVVKGRVNDTVQILQTQRTVQIGNSTQESKTVNPRITVWKASVSGISKHFWFGVGPGAVKETLFIEAQKNGEDSSQGGRLLNSHNQFLQSFLALGVLGFLSLLACFVVPFVMGIKYKDAFLLFFSVVTGLNNLLESMQERHVGNLFFGFFFCFLLLFCFAKRKTKTEI